MGRKGHPSQGLKNKIPLHSSAFPDSPRSAGKLQPSCCKWGILFPGLRPSSQRVKPSGTVSREKHFLQAYWGLSWAVVPPVLPSTPLPPPGAQGSESIVPAAGKGSEVEATHIWCWSEGFSSLPACLFPASDLFSRNTTTSPQKRQSMAGSSLCSSRGCSGLAANPLLCCHLKISFPLNRT